MQAVENCEKAGDSRLVEAILRRDRKATAEFVERYADPVYSYVRRRLFPRADLIDDVVQDVFLAAWQQLPAYRGLSSLEAWLLGIARHKVEDLYRRRLREPIALPEEGQPLPVELQALSPSDNAIDRQRLFERTRRVLASLPEPYALALLWRYWERRSTQEMAELAGKTEKAMERLLARAREQFRRRWTDDSLR